MKVFRGPHFQVVLWRFYVALFGKTARFAGVINVLIPLHVNYIVRISSGGADATKDIYFVVVRPAKKFLFRIFSFWAARGNLRGLYSYK